MRRVSFFTAPVATALVVGALVVGALGASAGCSAIVQPDPSRLGGRDAGGGGGVDAGAIDTGPIGVDAFSSMGCGGGCDDGVACTVDACVMGRCEHTPDDGACGPMQRCTATGCVATTCSSPADCNDGNLCTIDRCISGACMPIARDVDMDGHGDAACGGDDCDDRNPAVAPGLPERCGNGVDDDCNPATSDVCGGVLPDRCETAQLVDLSSGSAVLRGDFGPLAADYATFCIDDGRRAARDAVYRIELGTDVSDLRIETVGDVDTVLSVSNDCSGFLLPACNDDQSDRDTNARLWLHPTAGTIYLLVSAFDATSGPYEVRITKSAVATNECGGGTLDVTAGGTWVGVPVAPSRGSGSCMPDGTRGAIEAVARFEGPDISRLRLYAGYQAYLYARAGCDATAEELCEVATSLGPSGSFVDTNVTSDARRLSLFIDGGSRSDQGFALFVEP